MASSSSSPPPCRLHPRWKYENDVYVSSGNDTVNFLSHLLDACGRERVQTFSDERLQKGAETMQELFKAIEGSKVSVIIFSKRYPFSESCMQQLAKIMECQKEYQIVIPVFYEVLPSNVRWQEGSFGKAFVVHKKNLMPGLDTLKADLVEASNLAGWDSKATRPEATLVQAIVNDIVKKLKSLADSMVKELDSLFGSLCDSIELSNSFLNNIELKNLYCKVKEVHYLLENADRYRSYPYWSLCHLFTDLRNLTSEVHKLIDDEANSERQFNQAVKKIDRWLLRFLDSVNNLVACHDGKRSPIFQQPVPRTVSATYASVDANADNNPSHNLSSSNSRFKVLFPNLETLELCAIRSVKIWCNQFAAVCSQNLTRLIVHGCEKLKYLFPSSIVRNFVQLKHLEICYCMALEKIVGKERGEEVTATFVFPKVTFMKLWNLSELKTFYPGIHTSEWPMLKKLEVCGCDKAKIFTSEFPRFHESSEEGHFDIPTEQALFLDEKVKSNLEELKLSGKDISLICQGQIPKHLFQNLKILEVLNDKSENFPIGFLKGFHNLEKLELRCSAYKEIFSNGEVEKHVGMLTQIKSLKLWELSGLMYMWRQDSNLDLFVQNLEILEVWWCENLINLLPSAASFKNLTTLEVWYCHRLMNLVTSSTAKSLVCLMKLRIDSCKMITEIVSKQEDDVGEDEIVFSKLKWVSLERLENLTRFCSGNYNLNFPYLEDLFVIDCPKMKIFACRVISTPRLREVRQNWGLDKGCWESDLNTTMQQLHKNKLTLLPPSASPSFSHAAATTAYQLSSNLPGNRKTQKAVLKLEIHDEKAQQKAFNIVSKFTGVISISFDMEKKKMTVIGDIDAVSVAQKLRKQLCFTELVSVGPANETKDEEREEREGNNEESKSADEKKAKPVKME